MSKLDDLLTSLENAVAHEVQKRISLHSSSHPPKGIHFGTKQEIKTLIRQVIGNYSMYPSHYKVEDVLADQLKRLEEL